jgi:hypothetical protein
MREVTIEVRCIGCNELTTPQTIDWELFRLGIHVHNTEECLAKGNAKLAAKFRDVVDPNREWTKDPEPAITVRYCETYDPETGTCTH